MSTGFIVYIMIQFVASIALIYGFMHEKKVIAFEDKLWANIKAMLHSKKAEGHTKKKRDRNNLTLVSPQSAGYPNFNHVA